MSDESSENTSQRYELTELFPGEAPETLQCIKIAGSVIVVMLVVLALLYPFLAG